MASRTLKTFSMRFGKSMHILIRSHPASIHINFTDFKRTISLLRTKPRQLELRGATVTHFLRRSFAASSDTSPTQTDPALKLSESCVKKVFYSNFYNCVLNLKSKIKHIIHCAACRDLQGRNLSACPGGRWRMLRFSV